MATEPMKKTLTAPLVLVLLIALAWTLVSYNKSKASAWNRIKNPETVQMLKQFVALKKAQADASTNNVPPEIQAMFKYAERGDWLTLSNAFIKIGIRNGHFASTPTSSHGKVWTAVADWLSQLREKIGWHTDPDGEMNRLRGTPWEAIKEVWGAFDGFAVGDEKYSAAFGRDIIDSIPAGSIYFGGTDPGRFIVTAMCKSQPDGDPFFTLTQNALADGTYLDYLRGMYGGKIYIPTAADSQNCFQEFVRGKTSGASGGSVTVSGQSDVMAINGLIVKVIFDRDTNREVFIEENFPLESFYPSLEPHGLIFKVNRQPVDKLSDEIIQRDRDFWTKEIQPMIGDWLHDDTSVVEAAAFVAKVFGQQDFSGLKGDPRFIQNAYAHRMFSKRRSSIAMLYRWRMEHAADATDRERMAHSADFAFRQAWALCPYSPEVVYPYVNFLLAQNRADDAILVAETAAALPQNKGDAQVWQMVTQLKQWQKEHPPAPAH